MTHLNVSLRDEVAVRYGSVMMRTRSCRTSPRTIESVVQKIKCSVLVEASLAGQLARGPRQARGRTSIPLRVRCDD
jgi:hypothetical protein